MKKTKAIFVLERLTAEKINRIIELGGNTIFVGHKNISPRFAKKAKESGLKLFIEISLFVGKELLEKFPDSVPIDKYGRSMLSVDWYNGVCPNNQKIQKLKLEEISKILNTIDLDGLYLDFIRYPCHWEDVRSKDITEYCFCPTCKKLYAREKEGCLQSKDWYQWKTNQITDFVRKIKLTVEDINKGIGLGIFSVPWRKKDYNNAIIKIIGQDFKRLSRTIDVFSPMTYHLMTGNNTNWISAMVSYFSDLTKKPVLPLIQTENKPSKLSAREFESTFNQAMKSPSSGVIVFFLEDLLKDKKKMEIVKNQFSSF